MPETLLERAFTFCEEHAPAAPLPLPAKRMLDIQAQVRRCESCREATKQTASMLAHTKPLNNRLSQGKWWFEFPSYMASEERWRKRLKQYKEAGRGN